MTTHSSQLPQDKKLDIAALSRVFQSTSTSYKFLFFMAILSQLESKHWKEGDSICLTLEDLAAEMALISWYPVKFYKLSFGWQDQVSKIINKLDFDPSFKAITSKRGQEQLRVAIKEQAKDIGLYSLLNLVPYRLQSVFFSDELKGIPETSKNNEIAELANQYNSATIPLYQYVPNGKLGAIQISDEWFKYLLHDSNITIVKDWVLWKWVGYLQKRNPNTPAIINKVLPPIKRSSLNNQTSFWKKVIQADSDIRCIYTGEKLSNQPFALDHFLPWTFVCHDQPWNLCPVNSSANSSKGNRLPADVYVERFISQQHKALEVGLAEIGLKKWNTFVEPYAIDLRLAPELLLDESSLFEAYSGVLNPMMKLAKQTGFNEIWTHES